MISLDAHKENKVVRFERKCAQWDDRLVPPLGMSCRETFALSLQSPPEPEQHYVCSHKNKSIWYLQQMNIFCEQEELPAGKGLQAQ